MGQHLHFSSGPSATSTDGEWKRDKGQAIKWYEYGGFKHRKEERKARVQILKEGGARKPEEAAWKYDPDRVYVKQVLLNPRFGS
jgi:hypothetical protein